MGFLDELKRLTHPYEDEMEDDYDEDEDVYEDEDDDEPEERKQTAASREREEPRRREREYQEPPRRSERNPPRRHSEWTASPSATRWPSAVAMAAPRTPSRAGVVTPAETRSRATAAKSS